jgi:hypothetical protein
LQRLIKAAWEKIQNDKKEFVNKNEIFTCDGHLNEEYALQFSKALVGIYRLTYSFHSILKVLHDPILKGTANL